MNISCCAHLRKLLPLACLGVLVLGAASRAKPPRPAVPAQGKVDPAPVVSEDVTIPRDELLTMYRTELGDRFRAEDADKLLNVHQIIETYFAARTAADRKAAVQALEQSGVEPTIIGRLTRLRMHWPALDAGVYYVNEKHGPYDVRYFLGVPKGYDRARAWPMVVKLAPPFPFLANPPPNAEQVVKIYNDWIGDELTRHGDALVLMPLLNLDELYGPSYAGMNSVIQPMLHAAERANVDPARVYLMGHSTGGHATWNLALHYPTYFAAIAPLAGGASQDWQRLRLMNLRNTLPVVWHDADDKIVKVESSRGVVKAMRNLKIDVDYQETKGLGHAPPESVAEERYRTMRGRVRELYPAKVSVQSDRPDVMFNRDDWVQIWQADDPGKDRRLLFRRGTGFMVVTEHSAKVEAVRDGNTIELTLGNVAAMRVYLNDRMVNLAQPLTIVINKKKIIKGMARPSIEQMMNDQLFLGRGWRYYTAVLDIDTADPAAATQPTTAPTTTRPAPRPATPKTGKIIVGPGAASGD